MSRVALLASLHSLPLSTGCRVSSQNRKHTWFSVHMRCALFQSESCAITYVTTFCLEKGTPRVLWEDERGSECRATHTYTQAWIRTRACITPLSATSWGDFALMNLARADATIAAWDAKYHFHNWRPITAILASATRTNRRGCRTSTRRRSRTTCPATAPSAAPQRRRSDRAHVVDLWGALAS